MPLAATPSCFTVVNGVLVVYSVKAFSCYFLCEGSDKGGVLQMNLPDSADRALDHIDIQADKEGGLRVMSAAQLRETVGKEEELWVYTVTEIKTWPWRLEAGAD